MSLRRATQLCAVTVAVGLSVVGCTDQVERAAAQSTPALTDPRAAAVEPSPAEPTAPVSVASAGDGNGLASVQADVESIAVSLESFYRGKPYPLDVEAVIGTLDDAGLRLTPGNQIGSYRYDRATVEFALCVQDEAGAWATYDTAPMTLRESAESGYCPQ